MIINFKLNCCKKIPYIGIFYATFPFLETKEDRAREIDPKLLFPLKEWLRGFLPDHKFSWEIDESPPELKDFAHRVLLTVYKLSVDNATSLVSFLHVLCI